MAKQHKYTKFVWEPNYVNLIKKHCGTRGVTMQYIGAEFGLSAIKMNKLLAAFGFVRKDIRGNYQPVSSSYVCETMSHGISAEKAYSGKNLSSASYNNTPYYNVEGYIEIVKLLKAEGIEPLNNLIMKTKVNVKPAEKAVTYRPKGWAWVERKHKPINETTIYLVAGDSLNASDVVGSWNCMPATDSMMKSFKSGYKVVDGTEDFENLKLALKKTFTGKLNDIDDLIATYTKANQKTYDLVLNKYGIK